MIFIVSRVEGEALPGAILSDVVHLCIILDTLPPKSGRYFFIVRLVREERTKYTMPVLESTDNQITPKSILRHRPIGEHAPNRSHTTASIPPVVPRASRLRPPDVGDTREDI